MRMRPGRSAPICRAWRVVPPLVLSVVAAASGAAAAPGVAAAAPGAGSIGLQLLDAPAAAGNDPRAQVYIVDHLAPGAVIHRRVEVTNTTDSIAHVLLYAAAASIANGSFLGAAGHTPNDLSTWTAIRPGGAEVVAGGRATATVTIAVPLTAAPGEQYTAIWAEVRSDPVAGGGLTQVSRVGIRVYLSIGPGGPPAADFTIDSLTAGRAPDGGRMVLARVHNTGGRALDMHGTLDLLAGPGGLSAGPFPVKLGTTLAITDTESVQVSVDRQVPAGPWSARITLRSGLLERTARATITFPDTGLAPAVTATSSRPGWLYPAIAGLLLATISAPLTMRHRHRHRPTGRQAAGTTQHQSTTPARGPAQSGSPVNGTSPS